MKRKALIKVEGKYYVGYVDIQKEKYTVEEPVRGGLRQYKSQGYITLQQYIYFTKRTERNPKQASQKILDALGIDALRIVIYEKEITRKSRPEYVAKGDVPKRGKKAKLSDIEVKNTDLPREQYRDFDSSLTDQDLIGLKKFKTSKNVVTGYRTYDELTPFEKTLADNGNSHRIGGLISPIKIHIVDENKK